ncbi:hypothetical protein Poly51_27670 [Rubripirellula tenax]|uniref:Uncharacterized protein n=1 Tax=Rubripirellula tenax TaxID=2528015 RepID=A0A5C6F8B4_9BACT|nr:hypothetical protein [Rubripirellula tenax]TWU56850.1 hypothetical protein Poly51_27670 [Rubripirellula tenax]
MSSSYPLETNPQSRSEASDLWSRQIAAVAWIVVAWGVGMLVFELTTVGEASSRDWVVRPSPETSVEAMAIPSSLRSSSGPDGRLNIQ